MAILWKFSIIYITYIQICYSTKNKSLPVQMPLCTSTNTPCLQKAAVLILKQLADEKKSSAGLPCIDPLFITAMRVKPHRNDKVGFTQNYRNMQFIGMGSAAVPYFHAQINPKEVVLAFDLLMDLFQMIGTCEWRGDIMDHEIDGNGYCNISSVNVTHKHKITFKRTPENKLTLAKYEMDLQPSKLLFDLSHLVPNNLTASKEAEDFFQKNGMEVFKGVKTTYDELFATGFLQLRSGVL